MNNLQPELGTVVFGILFGFGFAIGSWLWGCLVSLVSRARTGNAPQ